MKDGANKTINERANERNLTGRKTTYEDGNPNENDAPLPNTLTHNEHDKRKPETARENEKETRSNTKRKRRWVR